MRWDIHMRGVVVVIIITTRSDSVPGLSFAHLILPVIGRASHQQRRGVTKRQHPIRSVLIARPTAAALIRQREAPAALIQARIGQVRLVSTFMSFHGIHDVESCSLASGLLVFLSLLLVLMGGPPPLAGSCSAMLVAEVLDKGSAVLRSVVLPSIQRERGGDGCQLFSNDRLEISSEISVGEGGGTYDNYEPELRIGIQESHRAVHRCGGDQTDDQHYNKITH